MANILLVATGGTRAPTQLELAERFTRDGHAVRLLASTNALRFLGSHLLRRPKKIRDFVRNYRPALRETLAYFIEKPTEVPHIAEGKWADAVVMAPATCNSVGKLAAGVSDNYPLLVLRAIPRTKRVIVVPSMNPEMWYDPLFQRNIDLLNATEKYRVLCPTRGQMLSGDFGFGAQVPIEDIIAETYRVLGVLETDPTELFKPRAGVVPWAETTTAADGGETVLLVDPDDKLRDAIRDALRRNYPHLVVQALPSASAALEWLRDHRAAAVVTELDFPHGSSGHELIQHLRRPGIDDVQIIATSRRGRQEIGAEALAQQEVLFAPKPLNVQFVVGMVAGTLRAGARGARPTTRVLEAGDVLFHEGDTSREVYVVASGRLRIHRHDGLEFGFADAGEMVGELALVGRAPRAATLTAVVRTEVVVLDAESLAAFLTRQPAWVRLLLDSLVGHLRETSAKLIDARRSDAEGNIAAAPP